MEPTHHANVTSWIPCGRYTYESQLLSAEVEKLTNNLYLSESVYKSYTPEKQDNNNRVPTVEQQKLVTDAVRWLQSPPSLRCDVS